MVYITALSICFHVVRASSAGLHSREVTSAFKRRWKARRAWEGLGRGRKRRGGVSGESVGTCFVVRVRVGATWVSWRYEYAKEVVEKRMISPVAIVSYFILSFYI